MSPRRTAFWGIGLNLFFLACHPGLASLPGPLAALAVGGVLFAVPAIGWRARFGSGSRNPAVGVIRDVAVSTGVLVGILALHRLAGYTPTRLSMWNASWLIANVIFAAAVMYRTPGTSVRAMSRRELAGAVALFLASFGLYYFGATSVVPPQRDHDHEVQATGYGLATRFEPFLLTDRGSIFYFAHPPLLHLYAAGSFLHFGTFAELQYYDDASLRALRARTGQPIQPPEGLVSPDRRSGRFAYRVVAVEDGQYVLVPEDAGPVRTVPVEAVELASIAQRYQERPRLLETRTPNIVMAAATVALLGLWAARISRRSVMALLVAGAYATSPEVFIRSSYGGYFAIGAFTSLLMLMSIERGGRLLTTGRVAAAILAAGLAALGDHKSLLLPLSIAAVVFTVGSNWPPRFRRLLVWSVVGFGLGTAVFWAFGLLVSPGAFFDDHVATHVVDRITHDNPLGYGGYPGLVALWTEFAAHSGYVLLPLGLLLLAGDLAVLRAAGQSRAFSRRVIWLAWLLALGVVFSVVDWRMTKHLAPMLLPLHLALVPDRHAAGWRATLAYVSLACLIVWNIWWLIELAADFSSLTFTPVL